MVRATTKIIANIIRIFTDFLSVPNMMGNGPIIIMPPPLTSAFDEVLAKYSITMITTKKPTMTKTNPNNKRS